MAITLGNRISWESANIDEEGYRVYRSGYDFDANDLPEVLVTLPPGSNHYVDTTADMAADHFYMVSVFHGSQEIFTDFTLKVPASLEPQEIGQVFQGGFYIGNVELDSSHGADEGVWAIIMAGADAEPESAMQWKTAATNTENTSSVVDGWANTQAMAAAGLNSHPAAEYCLEFRGGGFDDWYLPSKDELNLAWLNRAENGLSSLLEFRGSEYYWTSTQTSADAWRQRFSDGSQVYSYKTGSYRVRPVRRLKLMI